MQDEQNGAGTPVGAVNDKASGKRRSKAVKPSTPPAEAPAEAHDASTATETPTGAEPAKVGGKRRSKAAKPSTPPAEAPAEAPAQEQKPETYFFKINPKDFVALIAPFANVSKATAHESHRTVRFTPYDDGVIVSATNFETWLFRRIPGIKWTTDVNLPFDLLFGVLKLLATDDTSVDCSVDRGLSFHITTKPSIDSFVGLCIKGIDPLAGHQFDDDGFEDQATTLTAAQIRQLNESFGYAVDSERPLAGGQTTNAYNQFQLVLGGEMDEIDLPVVILNLASATFVDVPVTLKINQQRQQIMLSDGMTTVTSYFMNSKRPNFDVVRKAAPWWQVNVDRDALTEALRFVQIADLMITVESDKAQLVFSQDGFRCAIPSSSEQAWTYKLNAKTTLKALATMETSLVEVSLVSYLVNEKEQTAWRFVEPGSDIVHFTGAIPVEKGK